MKVLTSHGITPAPGETPLEYATRRARHLTNAVDTEVADVPLVWVEAYYQDRFGGIAPFRSPTRNWKRNSTIFANRWKNEERE